MVGDTLPCLAALAIKQRWRTMSMSQRLFCHAVTPLWFTTRNCHTLTSKIKLEQLGVDLNSYAVDYFGFTVDTNGHWLTSYQGTTH